MIVALISLALVHSVTHPTSYECGPLEYVEGVRPDGRSRCILAPAGRGENECVRGQRCGPFPEQPSVAIRIWCPRGQRAVVVTERKVACR